MHGEETEFLVRLSRRGHRGVWVPRAHVTHVVPSERCRLAYVCRWFVGYGRTVARIDASTFQEKLNASTRGEARDHWVLRLKFLLDFAHLPRSPRWLALLLRASYTFGVLAEATRLTNAKSVNVGPVAS